MRIKTQSKFLPYKGGCMKPIITELDPDTGEYEIVGDEGHSEEVLDQVVQMVQHKDTDTEDE